MYNEKEAIMNAKTKPLPKVGVSSDGRVMHYSVGAIVQNERDEYFLMDRKHEPYGFAGMAGHIDAGETPRVALMREGGEEIGAKLYDVKRIYAEEVSWNFCRNDGVHRVEVHYWYLYRARVNSRDVRVGEDEAKRWEWFARKELRDGRYERRGEQHVLILEPVWLYWFEKTGIIPA